MGVPAAALIQERVVLPVPRLGPVAPQQDPVGLELLEESFPAAVVVEMVEQVMVSCWSPDVTVYVIRDPPSRILLVGIAVSTEA